MAKRQKHNYVDKEKLYQEIVKYRKRCEECENSGLDVPKVSDPIAKDIMAIAKNMAEKHNFRGYSFREDMIGDGILDACRAVANYNIEKKNPFGYFSLIIQRAFVRRIEAEKGYLYQKHKVFEREKMIGALHQTGIDQKTSIGYDEGYDSETDYMNDFVSNYEDRIKAKKQKAKERRERRKMEKENEDTGITRTD